MFDDTNSTLTICAGLMVIWGTTVLSWTAFGL